jgi:hypothetical protein
MSKQPEPDEVALVQLIATVTLALCTLIGATAVSIGLAHAGTPGAAADAARPATELIKAR